jgi:hypothetical protein
MKPDRIYSDKQEAFLEAICGEARGNIREAMRIAGYSPGTKVSEVVGPLREEIIERASLMLAMNAPKATFSIINVLDEPDALGARNAVSAAREILDRTGLVKKEQVEVQTSGGGLFVLPPKKSSNDDTPDDSTDTA